MKINELLPIGSVVLLNEGQKRLMIMGVKQTETAGEEKEYDYMGVFYPEGFISDEFKYLFNHDDIDTVFFRGYEDEERDAFIGKLSEVYAQLEDQE